MINDDLSVNIPCIVYTLPSYCLITDAATAQEQLRDSMIPVLRRIHTDVNKSNLINLPIYVLPSIHLFASK